MTETFTLDNGQTGTPSMNDPIGANPADFSISDDSLGLSILLLDSGGFFAPADNDYDAENSFNYPYTHLPPDTLYIGNYMVNAGAGESFVGDDGTVINITAANPVSTVPEPFTWLLMFTGIGGIGLTLRRAKRTTGFGSKGTFVA